MNVFQLLRRYLTLAIEGEDPPTDPDPPDDDLSTLEDVIEAEPGEGATTDDADLTKKYELARKEADDAKKEVERERTLRVRAEANRTPSPAAKPATDPDYEREEEQLRQAKASGDQNVINWAEFQVRTARDTRAARSEAAAARFEARDASDRSSFEKLEITQPKYYKLYAERVEQIVNDFKSKGQTPAPRRMIMRYLLGEDADNGKFTRKAKPAGEPKTVDRGKMPGARTDVRSKGGASEREKRRARLENVNI